MLYNKTALITGGDIFVVSRSKKPVANTKAHDFTVEILLLIILQLIIGAANSICNFLIFVYDQFVNKLATNCLLPL